MAALFTDQNFETEVLKSDKPVVVDFWAPWCGPCRITGPIIDELAEELKDKIKIGKLNVDEHQEKATEYSILSIPTMKVFKGGAVVQEFIGVQPKDTLKAAFLALV